MTNFEIWEEEAKTNEELNKALRQLSSKEIEDAFNGNLSFGTGGIRGIMGAGTNRLNVYTLRKANAGFGKYLLKTYKSECARGVVVSHDNRLNSREYAIESCRVLGAMGIKTYMFDDLRTTPELSFSVRYLNAIAGIMITASHNPPKYNGYKIYNEGGCQYTINEASKVIEEVDNIDNIFAIPAAKIEDLKIMGLYEILDNTVDDKFLEEAKSVIINNDIEKKIKIAYSPLHGTGAMIAKRALLESGFNAKFVEKQMEHDPMFKTVALPNPEDVRAFEYLADLGKKEKCDLLIATDPDADRVGIGVLKNKEYHYLTGNQTGALLIYYRFNELKRNSKLPKKGKIFNTIVTSELGAKIANSFGIPCYSTLTGFKFIGEQAIALEKTQTKFLFGYEESYGYLIKDYARDKDSIQSLLAIAEMANYYLVNEKKTLVDVLEDIYKEYGYYKEYTENIEFPGLTGKATMDKVMDHFRNETISDFAKVKVLVKEDYEISRRIQYSNMFKSKLDLPKSNVIKYFLDSDSWVTLRPSGTEPKLKIYFSVKGDTAKKASSSLEKIKDSVLKIVSGVVNDFS